MSIAKGIPCKSSDWQYALLQYQNTPISYLSYSPAQLVFTRVLKTRIPVAQQLFELNPPDSRLVQHQCTTHRTNLEHYYNRTAQDLEPLQPGD